MHVVKSQEPCSIARFFAIGGVCFSKEALITGWDR